MFHNVIFKAVPGAAPEAVLLNKLDQVQPQMRTAAAMWSQVRVLRRALLLTSLLTVSGLHMSGRRPAVGWRAGRLLTLALAAVVSGCALANTVTACPASMMMYCLTMGALLYHSLAVLVHLLFHRRRLHGLLRRAELLLKATALCQQPTDFRPFHLQTALLTVATVLPTVLWWTRYLYFDEVLQPTVHTQPLLPALLPSALQQLPGSGVVFGLQLV
ncbi:hypothetical protein FJT64_010882 [Amphibalanus amphitrite]|uniref:Uncharacterized protein n=1 Tax=Amphibalanus amphitrite TaxID=1232801 RepID=A0A6A4VB95_AMPAM|nr:hypothetical protein FJT64_010882 [Amphibalanus amphitrite]